MARRASADTWGMAHPTPPTLRRLVYGSSAPQPVTPAALADILSVSRRNNAAVGITGALLYADGCFMQFLEGPPGAVQDVYQRVLRDGRHRNVQTYLDQTDSDRLFGNWSMGLVDADALSLPDRAAVGSIHDVDPVRPSPVRRLMESFRSTMRADPHRARHAA